MRFHVAVALALMCFGSSAVLAQDSNIPPGQQDSADPGAAPSDDQRGTKTAPLVVEVHPTPESNAEAEENKAEREQAARNERQLVEFTGQLVIATYVLGGATVLLFLVTAGLLIFARRQASDARRSLEIAMAQSRDIKASTDAAIELASATKSLAEVSLKQGLPILRIHDPSLIYLERPDEQNRAWGQGVVHLLGAHNKVMRIIVDNVGKTAAFPSRVALGWTIAERLEGEPLYTVVTKSRPGIVIRKKAPVETGIDPNCISLSDADRLRIIEGAVYFWLFGCVYYTDFLDNEHEARFVWLWSGIETTTTLPLASSMTETPPRHTLDIHRSTAMAERPKRDDAEQSKRFLEAAKKAEASESEKEAEKATKAVIKGKK